VQKEEVEYLRHITFKKLTEKGKMMRLSKKEKSIDTTTWSYQYVNRFDLNRFFFLITINKLKVALKIKNKYALTLKFPK